LKALLRDLDAEPFGGSAWRVTDAERDPMAASEGPGRWDTGIPAVYLALSPEGAIAEFRHANGGTLARPVLHQMHVTTRATLRTTYELLSRFGVPRDEYAETKRARCQEIGMLAASLGFDSIAAPSARWNAQNLVLFLPNADDDALRLIRSDELAANALDVH
jgi:RES domain-containing protein